MRFLFLFLLSLTWAGAVAGAQEASQKAEAEGESGPASTGAEPAPLVKSLGANSGDFTVTEARAAWQKGSPELTLDEQFANVAFPALSVRLKVKTTREVTSPLRVGLVWMVTDDYRKSRWTDAWQEEFASELPALRTQDPPWASSVSLFDAGEAVLSADLAWSATTLLKSKSRENPGALVQFGGSETWALCAAVFDQTSGTLTVLRRWEVKAGWVAQIAGETPRLTSFTMSIPSPTGLDDLPPPEAWNRSVLPRTSFYNGMRVE